MFIAAPYLLAAGVGDLLGAVGMLLFLAFWVINQILEGRKKPVQPPGKMAGGQPPAPRPVPPNPQAKKPAAAGGLRGEMEEFLRRAANQQAQANRPAAQRAQKPTGDRIEVLINDMSTPGARVAGNVAAAAPKPPKRLAPMRRDSVADHVSQHVSASTRAVADQASLLGQRIVTEDAQFDVQLKAKFDHEVGTLAAERTAGTSSPGQPSTSPSDSPAAQIAALLASSGGARQAIMLNEILRRPSERW